MYNASRLYWDKTKEQNRLFELMVRIEHEGGTLNLSDKDIELGSFKVIDSSQTGEDFTIGGTVASHLEFTLVNKEKFENIKLIGAKVIPTIRLQLRGPIDAHFLQASQPSKIEGFKDQWEHIPLGQFNIDIADRLRKTIEVKAIDNMILLDKSYSLSTIKYPATLGRILNDVCSIAGVGTPVGNFVNSDYTVGTRPEGDYTLRNIVAFIAELSGSFAKFDRNGRLSMKWYEETDIEITSHQRVNFEQSDYEIQITGLRFDSKEKDEEDNHVTYLVGSDDYRVDLTGNVLLQDDYNIVLPKILENIENTKFAPYSADWQGNPAIDVGDILVHVDLDGVRHKTVVTNNEYVYRGVSKMAAKGLPSISRGFKSGDNRIASIIGRVESEFSSELSNLQQEQLMATELIGNMLGGHVSHVTEKDELKYNKFGNGIFIHDAPDLMDSIKIWKWGIGGFGFSDDGGRTYTTGVTIDGSIVANIISANHINTGTLSSNNNETWINLENGSFNFKNKLRWLNGELMVDGDITGSTGTFDGQVRAGNILIGGDNGSIKFGDISGVPDIPELPHYILPTEIRNGIIASSTIKGNKIISQSSSHEIVMDGGVLETNAIVQGGNFSNVKDGVSLSNLGMSVYESGSLRGRVNYDYGGMGPNQNASRMFIRSIGGSALKLEAQNANMSITANNIYMEGRVNFENATTTGLVLRFA